MGVETINRCDWVFVGYGMTLSLVVVLVYTFYAAYFTSNKSVLVTVNSFGEAHLEAVLLPVVLLFGLFGFYSSYKNIDREGKQ